MTSSPCSLSLNQDRPASRHIGERLPLELIICILNQCDLKTLVPCSRVCTTWSSICQPRIFEHVEFDTARDGLEKSIERISTLNGSRCTPELIRRMSLRFSEPHKTDDTKDENTCRFRALLRELVGLEGRFEGLVALSLVAAGSAGIHMLCGEDTRHPTIPLLVFTFQHVVDLNIYANYEDYRCVINFICSFPSLRALSLRLPTYALVVEEPGWQNLPAPTSVLPFTLETFHLLYSNGNFQSRPEPLQGVENWLSTHPPRQIKLFSVVDSASPRLGPYFSGLCRETQSLHLALDFRYFVTRSSERHNLSLLNLDRLERIIITFRATGLGVCLRGAWRPGDAVVATAASLSLHILDSITSPHLHAIVLNVFDPDGFKAPIPRNEWNQLDEILSSSTGKFARCTVEIVIPHLNGDEGAALAREAFPKTNSDGRLTVVRTPYDLLTLVHGGVTKDTETDQMNWVCDRIYQMNE
ncbi:hypothetical protein PM082_014982 [Marasmius tenuissimus]|nr:hypothetical protein PM082_014982 [Marasmius tenuissimus]